MPKPQTSDERMLDKEQLESARRLSADRENQTMRIAGNLLDHIAAQAKQLKQAETRAGNQEAIATIETQARKKAEAERAALQTQLQAWHTAFETTQLTHALAERDALAERIAALEAIMDRLPKTADGVPIIPGEDTVWLCGFIGGAGGVVPLSYAEEYVVSPFDLGSECEMHYILAQNVSYCYSTREAALDQKEPEE